MPDFLVCLLSLDDLDVKRALVMTDNTLGETCTDEISEEAEPNASSPNQGSPKVGHANELSTSSNDITPKSGHADDSGISTNDSPEKDQYANDPAKVTSMNRMSRSSLQDQLKSRLGSIKEKPAAPQPPVPVPRVKSRDNSGEKTGSLERKTSLPVKLEKSQTESSPEGKPEASEGDRKASSFKESKSEETDKKMSFKESLERKLTSRKSLGSQDEPSSKGRHACRD